VPVVSDRGLDSMTAMTRAVTNLNTPGYNTTNMTNTTSLNPQQPQQQQPLQFGSTSKQLFSPGFNNTVNNAKGQEGSHPGQGLVFSQTVSVLQHLPEGDKTSTLQLGVSNQTSPGQARIISLTVTDPSDYFFYFSLSLTENDFNILRQSQGLLVDFGNFSNMLVQLLEKCKAESSCPQPSFVLVLNLTKAQPCLEFTELNMFKHLVHLSLVVLRASDTQLKDYLVTSITKLSRDKEQRTAELQRQVDSLQQQLESSLEQLHARTGELEQVRSELSSQASSLERRLARDVEGEKERAGQQLQELQWKYEADKREAESKHAKVVQQLENRVASLDVQNRDLWEVRVGQESSLREARGQLQCRDEEVARLKRDMAGLRQEKVMVDTVGSDREKHVGQVTARLAKVERDLQDKEAQVTRIQEAASRIQEDTTRLESQLEEKVKLVDKRENTIKKLSAEIIKANEIISKLQDGVNQEQARVKLRGQIATEQEKLLGDRDKELGECRDQLRESKQLLDSLNSKLLDIERMVEERDEKVQELEKVIKTLENVNNWLNKQITPGSGGGAGPIKKVGVASSGVRGGRGRQPLTTVQNHMKTKSSTDMGPGNGPEEKLPGETGTGGLDPKYFVQSTPGGTAYRHQIPQTLPANVRRGAGLVRKEV